METADLRALLAAHPAVAIVPWHGRPGTLCVRVSDLSRLTREAGHDLSDDEIERLVIALDGQRLLLVDPASRAGSGGIGRERPARGSRGRASARPERRTRPRRGGSAKQLDDLAVYELPAAAFGAP